MTEAIDVLLTSLDLCGIKIPDTVQGRSLLKYESREMVFCENIMPEVITNGDTGYPYTPGKGIDGIRHPDSKMTPASGTTCSNPNPPASTNAKARSSIGSPPPMRSIKSRNIGISNPSPNPPST